MHALAAETVGTALLILLGNGVVANVLLNQTKGNGGGWIVITFGWAIAVFVGVLVTAGASGAHLNPAISVALAASGKFAWGKVPAYVSAQMLGAAMGTTLVWFNYKSHFDATPDGDAKLAVFCTGPAVRSISVNLAAEATGTFVLAFAALHISSPVGGLGSLDALPIALVVLGIGLSLGGTTGYAINPARDLAPRLIHSLLPIPGKRDSDWSYAWIPVVGPLLGALLAVGAHRVLN